MEISESLQVAVERVQTLAKERRKRVMDQVKVSNNPLVTRDKVLPMLEPLLTRLAVQYITEEKLLVESIGYNLQKNQDNNHIVYVESKTQSTEKREININSDTCIIKCNCQTYITVRLLPR